MASLPWFFWAGTGLALLVFLGVLLRRPPGGRAALFAALTALAALWGPTFLQVERRSWDVLVLREEGCRTGRVASFPGGPAGERRVFRLGGGRILPPGASGAGRGLPSWTALASLVSAFCSKEKEEALLACFSHCPPGLEEVDLPPGTPAWAHLEGKKGKGETGRPTLEAWIPRAPRQGRPWFFLVRTGPWKRGEPLELRVSPGGGGRAGPPLRLEADGEGYAFGRIPGPSLPAGKRRLVLTCRGKGGRRARGLLVFSVLPPPAVALAGRRGALGSLLEAQGFRLLSWEGGGRIPQGAEVLAWDGPGGEKPDGGKVAAFLQEGGGLLCVGRGLRSLAALEGVAPFLPVKPLPERPEKKKTGPEERIPPSQRRKISPSKPPPTPLPPPPRKAGKPPKEKVAHTATLLIALDVSGSMYRLIRVIRAAAEATARALDEGDRFGVLAFSGDATLVVPPGPAGRQVRLLYRMNGLAPGGATLVWPALDLAMRELEKEKTSVKAVLIFTDGIVQWGSGWGGSGKRLRIPTTVAEAAEAFRKKGISVSSVIYENREGGLYVADARFEGTRILDTLSKVTGGHTYLVKDPSKVVKAFLAEAERIRPGTKGKGHSPFPGRGGKEGKVKKEGPGKKTPKPAPPRKPPARKPRPKTPAAPKSLPVHLEAGGWLTEGLPEKLPPVAGLLPTLARPEFAWVPLSAGPGRLPLLAVTPPAVAGVAVWTSDSGEHWAGPWAEAGLLGGLLARTVTSLLRPRPVKSPLRAGWDPSGRYAWVEFDRLPPALPPRGRLLWEDSGKPRTVTLDWAETGKVRIPLEAKREARSCTLVLGEGRDGAEILLPGFGGDARGMALLAGKIGARPGAAPPPAGFLSRRRPAAPYLALASALLLVLAVLGLAGFRRRG